MPFLLVKSSVLITTVNNKDQTDKMIKNIILNKISNLKYQTMTFYLTYYLESIILYIKLTFRVYYLKSNTLNKILNIISHNLLS